jgi:dipeptidyl-peptidase-4
MTHGLADFIAQEEMNRYEGYWLSPDGSFVAFEEVDESHIPIYRIMHQGSDAVGAGAQEDHHYPFAGAVNPKVRLGVMSTAAGSKHVQWFDLGSVFGPDHYLARVSWLPDGGLVAQVQNRDQTALELVTLCPKSGAINRILREETSVWINLHDMFKPLKKASQFLWASERTGFQHLYLYDLSGRMIRQLTSGDWLVENIKGVDEEAGLVYFEGNRGNWLERHLFSVPLAGGEIRQLTREPGMHSVQLNTKRGLFADVRHSSDEPLRVELRSLSNGSLRREVYRNEDPRIKSLDLRKPEFFTLPSSDGLVTLQGALWKPNSEKFGPGPYPTVVSVYGGPHVQKIANSWGAVADMRAQFLRSKGYLVLSVDNRGSSRRGLKFEGAIKHDMGNLEVVDQVAGVKHCIKMGFTDSARVGIYGWSYGGYMAAMALAKEPDVFHAAISGAPVTHWDGYDTHYTERYMGTPQTNPGGYHRSAVMEHVARMRGKLLLVHGLLDENVHFRHTARLINALIKERKPYELLLFPDERHTPRGLGDRVFMEEQLYAFLDRSLLGPAASSRL